MGHLIDKRKPTVYIREITLMNDSIIWGGYSQKDLSPISRIGSLSIPAECHTMSIRFSVDRNSVFSPAKYRYRIDGGNWSAWSSETVARFNNMPYGPTTVEIEARDLYGNVSIGQDINIFESHNCIVHTTQEKKVVIQGLDGYIVAEKDDTLLICKLSEEQRIKQFSGNE
jgi:hypothetical protein